MYSEKGERRKGAKERHKQRERHVETKKGDFPAVVDNRNCCSEEGQVLRVVLMVGGGQEGWVATTLGRGSYRWKRWKGWKGGVGGSEGLSRSD